MKIQAILPAQSTHILKGYITLDGIVRTYFKVQPDSSLEDFEAEALDHPDFLLEEK